MIQARVGQCVWLTAGTAFLVRITENSLFPLKHKKH